MTSFVSGEGKTLNCYAFAQSLAVSGLRVGIVGADPRTLRHMMRSFPNTPRTVRKFVTPLDSHEVDVDVFANEYNVDLIPLSDKGGQRLELYKVGSFPLFIEGLKNEYDVILIDGPAILVDVDSLMMARYVDKLILTVRYRSTSAGKIREGLRKLEVHKASESGFLLSGVPEPRGR